MNEVITTKVRAKGFLSIIFVAIFAIGLFAILSSENRIGRDFNAIGLQVISIEKKHSLELHLKNAVKQVLDESGNYADGKAFAAKSLASLESYLENQMLKEDVSVDFWIGSTGDFEVQDLNIGMRKGKKALKCANCIDLNTDIPIKRGEEVLLVKAAYLLLQCNVGVPCELSSNGLGSAFLDYDSMPGTLKDFVERISLSDDDYSFLGIGASVYFQNDELASVVLIPIGFNGENFNS